MHEQLAICIQCADECARTSACASKQRLSTSAACMHVAAVCGCDNVSMENTLVYIWLRRKLTSSSLVERTHFGGFALFFPLIIPHSRNLSL